MQRQLAHIGWVVAGALVGVLGAFLVTLLVIAA
jgi:hypothetical protein